MKTIRIKIYKFEELSQDAKNAAIEKHRNKGIENFFIYDDAEKTVNAFNDLFGTSSGRNSWLDVNTDNFDENIINLKGLRLQKYILNNFGSQLFKRKYLKHGKMLDKNIDVWHRMRKVTTINQGPNKGKFSISYYSNLNTENSCVLTGMCYDNNLLNPIYNFLELRTFDSTNFDDLINECFYSLKKTIELEEEYLSSDDGIIEKILSNDYDFLKDGTQY
jgi:hypothetical protein